MLVAAALHWDARSGHLLQNTRQGPFFRCGGSLSAMLVVLVGVSGGSGAPAPSILEYFWRVVNGGKS